MQANRTFECLTISEARALYLKLASAGQQASGAAEDCERAERRQFRTISREAFRSAVTLEDDFPTLLTGLELAAGSDWQLRLVPATAGAQ